MTAADMVQALSLFDRLQDHRRDRLRTEFDRDRSREDPGPDEVQPDDPKIAQIKPIDERGPRRR